MRIGGRKASNGMIAANGILVENTKRKSDLRDPNKIFVGNLARNTTEAELKEFSKIFGDVVHIRIMKNHVTNVSKCFGFIKFADPLSATSALTNMKGLLLNGRPINCDNVVEKEKIKVRKGKKAREEALAAKEADSKFSIPEAVQY